MLWSGWYNYHQVFFFRSIIVYFTYFAFTWHQCWVFAQTVLLVSLTTANDSDWEQQERTGDQGKPTQKECRCVSPCGVYQPTYETTTRKKIQRFFLSILYPSKKTTFNVVKWEQFGWLMCLCALIVNQLLDYFKRTCHCKVKIVVNGFL